MAHQITERDGVFSVREPLWHGLGTVLPEYPTREEAQALVHGWEPVEEPIYRRMLHPDLTETYEPIEGWQHIVRSDDGHSLGVNTDTLSLVTNNELWDVAEAIQGEGADVRYETGGSLKGGAKVWLLLRLNEPIIIAGDPNGETICYYALQNAHDGSGSFRGQATNTRIVCDNTARASDLDARARGTEFTFRHTKNVRDRVEDAKRAIEGWRHSVDEYRRIADLLINTPVTPRGVYDFVERFIPEPPPHAASERVLANVQEARSRMLSILRGQTCEDIGGTAWGLVCAAVEYNQHVRKARSLETRFQRTYLTPSQITTDAVTLARVAAGV